MIDQYQLPILNNGGSVICIMSEDFPRKLKIEWKSAHWKMITVDGNWSELTKVATFILVNVHGIVIPVPVIVTNLGSEQAILCHPQGNMHCKV